MMKGQVSEQVRINEEAIRADLEKMGVTAQQVSLSMGYNKNFISNAFGRQIVGIETVHLIERALFKEEGAYVLRGAPVQADAKQGDIDKVVAHLMTLEKNLHTLDNERLNNIEAELNAIEQQIKSTNTWLARLYAVWTNEQKAQKGDK